MVRIREVSKDYHILRKKMKRARRLYVLFCRDVIDAERDIALHRTAVKAQEAGLWKSQNLNDLKYSILRLMFAIDRGATCANGKYDKGPFDWHNWLTENCWRNFYKYGGWVTYDWNKEG